MEKEKDFLKEVMDFTSSHHNAYITYEIDDEDGTINGYELGIELSGDSSKEDSENLFKILNKHEVKILSMYILENNFSVFLVSI